MVGSSSFSSVHLSHVHMDDDAGAKLLAVSVPPRRAEGLRRKAGRAPPQRPSW